MAKQYNFGFVIDADNAEGIKVLKRTKEELDNLEKQSKKNKDTADKWTAANERNNKVLSDAKTLIVGLAGTVGIGLLINKCCGS